MQIFWLILIIPLISSGHCDDRSRADGAAAALMKYFNEDDGLFVVNGQKLWWTGANCLTAIIDYMIYTDKKEYMVAVKDSFEKGIHFHGTKNFTNEFLDDSGWWGCAWVRAYDLTKDKRYLQMAEHISDYIYTYHDNVCKGGIWWKNDKKYKSSISNELFIKLAASLHNRVEGDSKYLNQAKEVWNWLKGSGVMNGEHLIHDGIETPSCKTHGTTYTYNQGVILGGLVELHKATNDRGYLNDAEAIANGVIKSSLFNPNGILRDSGEGDECKSDGSSFKGAFIRNLGELSRALTGHPYHAYLEKNAESAFTHAKVNDNNQYGNRWSGPVKITGANCQHSVLDLFNAALKP